LEQACGDIILSDVDMPGISGLHFIESQFKKGCKVKNVGLMSGAWSEADLKLAQKLGCHVFQKPFTIDELNEWLDYCEGQIDPKRKLSNDWLKSKPPQSE
jgi:CheY-like chemotaxis protein